MIIRFLLHSLRYSAAALTMLLYVAMVASAYGGKVNPLVHAFPSVLHLAFPFLASAALAVALLWLALRARFVPLCGLLAFAVSLPQLLLIFPVALPARPKPGEDVFTLLTYNVYLGYDREYPERPGSRTMDYIIESGADVVCMQEMLNFYFKDNPKIDDALIDSIRAVYPYSIEMDDYNEMAVMALSKYPMRRLPKPDIENIRYFFFDAYEVDIRGRKVAFVNVHLDSYALTPKYIDMLKGLGRQRRYIEMKDSLMSKLYRAFRMRATAAELVRGYCDTIGRPVIVCGDFNDVSGSWAADVITGAGLRDAVADGAFGPMPTYNAHNMLFHIDQILYAGAIRPLRVWRGNIRSSDHYPVFAQFVFDEPRSNKK